MILVQAGFSNAKPKKQNWPGAEDAVENDLVLHSLVPVAYILGLRGGCAGGIRRLISATNSKLEFSPGFFHEFFHGFFHEFLLGLFVCIFLGFGRRKKSMKKSMEKFMREILAEIHGPKKNPCPAQKAMQRNSMDKCMPTLS